MSVARTELVAPGVGVAPATKLQVIAVADIGKYGRIAFERHEALNGRAIDIAGDQATVAALVNTARRILLAPPGLRLVTDLSVPRVS